MTPDKTSSVLCVKLFYERASRGRQSEQAATLAIGLAWLALPLLVGPSLAEALNNFVLVQRTTFSIGLWALWVLGLLAILIPGPFSLAIMRVGAPSVTAVVLWALIKNGISFLGFIGMISVCLVTALALSAPIGDRFSDAASYGDERRFLLRAPGPVVVFFGPLAWVIVVFGFLTGPFALLEKRYFFGSALCFVGFSFAAVAFNAIYQLGKRWVVLVPAGIVFHDHLSFGDPTLITRNQLLSLSPARQGTNSLDLSQGSFGLLLEITCRDPLSILLKKGYRKTTNENSVVESFLINPTRPNVLLMEAQKRGLKV